MRGLIGRNQTPSARRTAFADVGGVAVGELREIRLERRSRDASRISPLMKRQPEEDVLAHRLAHQKGGLGHVRAAARATHVAEVGGACAREHGEERALTRTHGTADEEELAADDRYIQRLSGRYVRRLSGRYV